LPQRWRPMAGAALRRASPVKASGARLLVTLAIPAFLAAVWAVAAWRPGGAPPDAIRQARERAVTPPGMVYVPGGPCLIGSNDPDADDDARPLRQIVVPSFTIDRTEVTNAEFRRFQPAHAFPPGEAELPVTNITYAEAEA